MGLEPDYWPGAGIIGSATDMVYGVRAYGFCPYGFGNAWVCCMKGLVQANGSNGKQLFNHCSN